MVRAKIITGGTKSERQKRAQELIKERLDSLLHPDLFTVEADPSVTITQVREIKKRIAMKPYSAPVKIIFIPEAEKITYPAQNALLKTLEEPPGETLIILLTPKKEILLPTIISRCEVISLPEKAEIEIDPEHLASHVSLLIQILNSRAGERLILAEKFTSSREEGIEFCQNQLVVWRQILRQDIPKVDMIQKHTGSGRMSSPEVGEVIQTLRQIHQALIMLEANVNPRLVIENLLLAFPQLSKA